MPRFGRLPDRGGPDYTATSTVVTTTTYNAANKYVPQTVVADAGTGKLNLTTAFTYDGVGNLTQVNGPRTDVTDTTTNVFDAQSRITQTTDALGKQTHFAFDADSHLIRRIVIGDRPRFWGPAAL